MAAQKHRIRVLITGGTFDKEYDEINGRLYFKDSHVPEMLELGRCFSSDSVYKNRVTGIFEAVGNGEQRR